MTAVDTVHFGNKRLVYLILLSALALLPGLGGSNPLTYHEAFVAQGAREILNLHNWAYPTIGGLPWLEKPPLPWWLVAALGHCAGGVSESVARVPSACAAILLVLGVAKLATRHYGPLVGFLAGAIQATTAWTVIRGRLAEADILLACLITWAIIAFDQLLPNTDLQSGKGLAYHEKNWRLWYWTFFVLLGLTSLVKGIGFGAVLILSVVVVALFWQYDGRLVRRLQIPGGWVLALTIGLIWPISMATRHGYEVLTLWTLHVSNRVMWREGAGSFAGEPWYEYIPSLLAQVLPWTPLVPFGAWQSLIRAIKGYEDWPYGDNTKTLARVITGDRLVWIWATVPLGLLTLAPIKNAHYAISTQIPWSIWAGLALAKCAARIQLNNWKHITIIHVGYIAFAALALAYGLGYWLICPMFKGRGAEWAFYTTVRYNIPSNMPVTLLYDDWDRKPYETPFGLIPHDLAVRLFYLVAQHAGIREPIHY